MFGLFQKSVGWKLFKDANFPSVYVYDMFTSKWRQMYQNYAEFILVKWDWKETMRQFYTDN
jgi:hypothetical protein